MIIKFAHDDTYMIIRTQPLRPLEGISGDKIVWQTIVLRQFDALRSNPLLSHLPAISVKGYLCRSRLADVVILSRWIPLQESRRMGSGGRCWGALLEASYLFEIQERIDSLCSVAFWLSELSDAGPRSALIRALRRWSLVCAYPTIAKTYLSAKEVVSDRESL